MTESLSRRMGVVTGFFLLLLTLPGVSMAADSPQAEIRFQPGREGPVWVGQELELNLDLFSTGFSFGGQQFILPEVGGAYLLQADSSTVKLTENRSGESWQGLRYTLLLYPQRQGLLEVPSFQVNFTASTGYGQEPESFRFETKPLRIEARLPPGADGTGLLVTSADFSVRTNWKPRQTGEESLQLKVGDSLRLTIERQASSVPGMVFSPLPEFSIDGLREYPETPRVNDRINRGELIGARTDSVSFICQREGSFEIPGIRFQWWDPDRERLNEEVSPGLSFEVIPNPAYATAAVANGRRWSISRNQLLMAIPVLALLVIVGWKASGYISRRVRQNREQRESGEPWAFRQAVKACSTASPKESYQAVMRWLERAESAARSPTLLKLAQASGDRELYREAERLQRAVVTGNDSDWDGEKLARLLGKLRSSMRQHHSKPYPLMPLNPP
jgi:hypothetical protein